jgi:hypothetical protein
VTAFCAAFGTAIAMLIQYQIYHMVQKVMGLAASQKKVRF